VERITLTAALRNLAALGVKQLLGSRRHTLRWVHVGTASLTGESRHHSITRRQFATESGLKTEMDQKVVGSIIPVLPRWKARQMTLSTVATSTVFEEADDGPKIIKTCT
jgi:hypothetical protein